MIDAEKEKILREVSSIVGQTLPPQLDPDRPDRCLAHLHLYRGWMAAFIAHVIRNDLGKRFRARFEHWRRHYLQGIRGRVNDARIASNHACLAAAFELFAEFMRDVWNEADQAARAFAEDYLADLVVKAAGAVEQETPARIFLDTLGELIAFERVRIDGIGHSIPSDDSREKDKTVGRLHRTGWHCPSFEQLSDDAVIQLSISLSMAAVQEHLKRQGRQPLQVSDRTLLDQLFNPGIPSR